MKKLKEDIKTGNFQKVYLLYGEEGYLIKAYKKSLKQGIIGTDDTMNYTYFEGKGTDFIEVKDVCDTLPFFAEKRLVIVENSGCFKSSNETILNYIEKIPETTYMVFIEKEVDKRSKMFKQVKNLGYACELQSQSVSELSDWILKMLKRDDKAITKDTMSYLLSVIGNDMENISKEIEKLICYTMEKKEIEKKDIDKICVHEINGKIFEMIDAMSNKNQKKLLKLYYDLIETKEPPMRILFMIARQFKIMLQVEQLRVKGYGGSAIADTLKLRSFIVTKIIKQLDNFKNKDMKLILESCADIEEKIKTGKIEEKIGVEVLLVKFSS